MDLEKKSLHDLAHKLSDITLGSGVEERGVGELHNAINRHEQVLLAGLKT
ncbi:hypothetical protein [Pseudomonas sp. UBA6562]|nr:hypothetical protein [Pseudomonas sp. UBA6562]